MMRNVSIIGMVISITVFMAISTIILSDLTINEQIEISLPEVSKYFTEEMLIPFFTVLPIIFMISILNLFKTESKGTPKFKEYINTLNEEKDKPLFKEYSIKKHIYCAYCGGKINKYSIMCNYCKAPIIKEVEKNG